MIISSRGKKDRRGLTPKQRKLADEYLKTGNMTQSALKVYNTTSIDVAKNIGSETLKKPNVRAYFKEKADEVSREMLKMAMKDEIDAVKYNACKDMLDRAGYKAIDQVEDVTPYKELTDEQIAERKQILERRIARLEGRA